MIHWGGPSFPSRLKSQALYKCSVGWVPNPFTHLSNPNLVRLWLWFPVPTRACVCPTSSPSQSPSTLEVCSQHKRGLFLSVPTVAKNPLPQQYYLMINKFIARVFARWFMDKQTGKEPRKDTFVWISGATDSTTYHTPPFLICGQVSDPNPTEDQ